MKPKMVVVKQEPPRGSVVVSTASQQRIAQPPDLLRCKRKNGCQPFAPQPASVARRNARERNRVKQVNNGFATLRSHIPQEIAAALSIEKPASRGSSAAAKKLSKVETLKMAVEYIRSLQELLDEQVLGGLEGKYESEENYYSSSPETLASSGDATYYSRSPESYVKCENDNEYFVTNRNFNNEMHETLTSNFYHARSPVKVSTYVDNDDIKTEHTFIPPKSSLHLQPTSSLSPPISDPCPSPTPSYSSDHSSLHAGSIVSTGSGQLTSRMSRLTTITQPQHIPVVAQHRSSPDYDSYEAMSPEDEELLDAISMWQQSN